MSQSIILSVNVALSFSHAAEKISGKIMSIRVWEVSIVLDGSNKLSLTLEMCSFLSINVRL